ncbi:MAG: DUF1592 domain-containing protein [Fimbriimonadaceae bacterium]
MRTSQARTSLGLLGIASIILLGAALLPNIAQSQQPKPNQTLDKQFDEEIYNLLEKYCITCHSGAQPKAGLDLGNIESSAEVAKNPAKFQKVILNIRSQVMPPSGATPTLAEREKIVNWLNRSLSANGTKDSPGRVTIRRLNRNEYNNTVRDLMYIDGDFSKDFPSDDVGYGFDNIGDVLTLTPLNLEMYLRAARAITSQAIVIPQPKERVIDFSSEPLPEGITLRDDMFGFYTNATFVKKFENIAAGEYDLELGMAATAVAVGPAKVNVTINGSLFQTIEVKSPTPINYKLPLTLKAGTTTIGVAFTNDYYNPNDPNPANRDRNLILKSFSLNGPANGTAPVSDSQQRLIFSVPTSTKNHLVAAREVLEAFATRAYRRPITSAESNRIMEIYQMVRKNNDPYEEGIRVCMQAILVNPNFLFRVELDSATGTHNISSYEVASRLSYFLWNSLPDQTLLNLAKSDQIKDPKVLQTQITRMLVDPKSTRFSDNFSTQWLQIARIYEFVADPVMFTNFNDKVRLDYIQETSLFFQDMLRNDRPIHEFIDGKYTFLNNRLAQIYEIPGDFDQAFRRVDVSAHNRGGLLGMGAILTVTSNPNRTSPVKRGKFIMEQILGTPLPPPPPDVGVLDKDTAAITAVRIRERLEQHRADPSCASCHRPLDAYGFALENFDAIGRFRTADGQFPVDNIGELPGKTTITGVEGLRKNLIERETDFTRTLTEKLMIYALGRGLTPSDSVQIEDIAKRLGKKATLKSIITEIILSDSFRKRSGQKSSTN